MLKQNKNLRIAGMLLFFVAGIFTTSLATGEGTGLEGSANAKIKKQLNQMALEKSEQQAAAARKKEKRQKAIEADKIKKQQEKINRQARVKKERLRKQEAGRRAAAKRVAQEKTYALTVKAIPANAKISIRNIGPKYKKGIKLKPGKYQVRVEKKGYETKNQWVTLGRNNKTTTVVLRKKKAKKQLGGRPKLTKPTQGQKYGSWGVQCETTDGESVCYLQQVLSEKGSKEPLMVSVVGYGKGKKHPTAIFELPKDINMSKGIQLKVDKYKPVGFKGKCDAKGCRGGFTLDQPLTQQFMKGTQALIAFRKNGKSDPVLLPVSLKGMKQGLLAVK